MESKTVERNVCFWERLRGPLSHILYQLQPVASLLNSNVLMHTLFHVHTSAFTVPYQGKQRHVVLGVRTQGVQTKEAW
jgi:hypothetical protein